MGRWKVFLLLPLVLALSLPVVAAEYYEDSEGNLRLENEYIAIFINQGPENKGRFALDVTGGDPLREDDNNKPLIYGHPRPWTSYTTVRIDGENFVFGGETNRRAGRDAQYGEVVRPPEIVNGQKLVTETQFGEIMVTQELSFKESTTTGLPDTARITYKVENLGEDSSRIGMRVMLDTMLGANDGAPFRVKDEEIDRDKVLIRDEIPEFWQAFDSLQDPQVMAQGDLKGPGLTPPDEVYFSNWGSLADGIWDFNFRPGREFIREGEFELDSAMALYWMPEELEPGETREYTTSYGLGGITIVPGILTIGTSSPPRVVFDDFTDSFPIIAYIQNTSNVTAKDVEVGLEIPESMELIGETGEFVEIGDIPADSGSQVAWQVAPIDELDIPEMMEYKVRVEASNTDDNEITGRVELMPPAVLDLELKGPERLLPRDEILEPNPFTIHGIIKNTGGSPAYGVRANLALPPGLSLAYRDRGELELGVIEPGEEVEVRWRVKSHEVPGEIPYALEVSSRNTRDDSVVQNLQIGSVPQKLFLRWEDEGPVQPGDLITAQVILGNIPELGNFELNLHYPEEILRPIYISRGNLLVQGDELLPFQRPSIDYSQGLIEGLGGELVDRDRNSGVLAYIHFRVLETGTGSIDFDRIQLRDREGNELSPEFDSLELNIE